MLMFLAVGIALVLVSPTLGAVVLVLVVVGFGLAMLARRRPRRR